MYLLYYLKFNDKDWSLKKLYWNSCIYDIYIMIWCLLNIQWCMCIVAPHSLRVFNCPFVRFSEKVPWSQVLLYIGCPLIRVSLEGRFYCIEGALSSECPLKTGFTVEGVLSSECPLKTGFTVLRVPYHQSVPWRQVLLYRGCPLIRVSPEDRFYCIEGVLSSECPLKTGFTV